MDTPARPPKRPATYADIEAAPAHLVAEIIDGELMTHHHGTPRSAVTRSALSHAIGAFRARFGRIGGWTMLHLPEVWFADDLIVPDLAAWRIERLPCLSEQSFTLAPDWVCEVVSDETVRRDRTLKMRIYADAGIPHMWLIDPRLQLLEAYELRDGHWMKLGAWNSDDEVRAAPFDAISFSLADLWPLDKPLGFNEDPQALYAGDR